jgi:hypothetical protein
VIRRVPAFDDETVCPFEIDGVYQRRLPGLTGRPSFRVTMPPTRERLALVTHKQVIAEGRIQGNRALERWRIDWVKQHDRWAKTHRTASDAEILERWRKAHAGRDCWVLTIALIEPVRLLPQQGHVLREVARRGTVANARHVSPDMLPDGNEYTTAKGATIDRECEAVDEATLTRIVAGELETRALAEAQRRLRKAGLQHSRIRLARRST